MLNIIQIIIVASICYAGSVNAEQNSNTSSVGFKSFPLGESYNKIEKGSLKCPSNENISVLTSGVKGQNLKSETLTVLNKELSVSSKLVDADVICSIRGPETIAGMKIKSSRLYFYNGQLEKIQLHFSPTKKLSTYDDNYISRNSLVYNHLVFITENPVNSEIAILLKGLKERYGAYKTSSSKFCGNLLGECRGAPYKIVHEWVISDTFIRVEYVGIDSFERYSFIEYSTSKYLSEQTRRREAINMINKKVSQIEYEMKKADESVQNKKNVKDM